MFVCALSLSTKMAYSKDTYNKMLLGKQKQKQRWKLRLRKIEIEHKNRVKEEHRCVDYEGQRIVIAEIQI